MQKVFLYLLHPSSCPVFIRLTTSFWDTFKTEKCISRSYLSRICITRFSILYKGRIFSHDVDLDNVSSESATSRLLQGQSYVRSQLRRQIRIQVDHSTFTVLQNFYINFVIQKKTSCLLNTLNTPEYSFICAYR